MVSKPKPIVLGVDLDGVCADFYGYMRTIAAEFLERDVADLPEDVSYGLPEWGIRDSEHYLSLHRFAVTQRHLFDKAPMIPGARRVLRSLADEKFPSVDGKPAESKYRIRIITHRLFVSFFHGLAVEQTIDWLDYHGIPYHDLCFMKDKFQVGADIYIDDAPSNVEALRKNGLYTICFGNSTNRNVEAPRASSWDEAYAIIKSWGVSESPPLADSSAPEEAPDARTAGTTPAGEEIKGGE